MPALQELLSSFSENMRTSLENLFRRYHFSESQKLEIAKDESDLRQWKEKPFYSIADYTAIDSRKDGRKGDSYILQQRRYMETLRKGETDYSSFFFWFMIHGIIRVSRKVQSVHLKLISGVRMQCSVPRHLCGGLCLSDGFQLLRLKPMRWLRRLR